MSLTIDLAKRFMASQYPVWGADGSKWEDRIETPQFPDLSIVPSLGGSFMGWKATQGAGNWGFVDRTFRQAWQQMREYNQKFPEKMIMRLPFHFWDYYPGHYTGSAEIFGADQGKYTHAITRNDPGEIKVYLDAESFPPWGELNWLNNSRPMQIAGGFRKSFADLAGYEPGLYTNPGLLPYFGDQFKDMDLWLAWYNKSKTLADIRALMKRCGWRGKLCFWQYTSDGDLDQDGTGDGLKLGMEEKALDLDIWMDGGMQEFSAYCGQTTPPVVPVPPVTEDPIPVPPNPVPTPTPTPSIRTKLIDLRTVQCPNGLNIRVKPAAGATPLDGWIVNGKEIECLETVRLGSDIWRRIGQTQYAAELVGGVRYLK